MSGRRPQVRACEDRRATRSLASYIRSIPDFPKPGIVFRDITPLLASPVGLGAAIDALTEPTRDLRPDIVIGAEARGFLFGPALARELGAGLRARAQAGHAAAHDDPHVYSLEYGASVLELHDDCITPGARVLVHDDLLATGGTARRAVLARRGARRRGRRLRVSHRARLPARSCDDRPARGARAHQLRLGVGAARLPTVRRARTLSATPEELWAIVGDAYHLPRWWPRVTRVEGVEGDAFTQVLTTPKGVPVRADFQVVESAAPAVRRWEQQLVNTPFERLLAASSVEIRLERAGDAATRVAITLTQRMRGLGLLGGVMVRTAGRPSARRRARRAGGAGSRLTQLSAERPQRVVAEVPVPRVLHARRPARTRRGALDVAGGVQEAAELVDRRRCLLGIDRLAGAAVRHDRGLGVALILVRRPRW